MAEVADLLKKRPNIINELNDDLREVFHKDKDINVATMIVVGDQSHGKSSLIERLTRVSLPRGEHIQTRAPTELRIKNCDTKANEIIIISYTFSSTDYTIECQLEELEGHIRDIQSQLTGNDCDITDVPIYIDIYKKDVEPLTIIDLPGLTRVKDKGQTLDIESKVYSIYDKYMEPEETLIINVVSAMSDIKTSGSFDRSNKFDPGSKRTILCITKADQHKEAGLKKHIENALIKLKIDPECLFITRNRTQQEIEEGINLEEIDVREDNFFKTNNDLKKIRSNMKGVKSLINRLIILQRIRTIEIWKKSKRNLIHKLDCFLNQKKALGEPYLSEIHCCTDFHEKIRRIFQTLNDSYSCNKQPAAVTEEYVISSYDNFNIDFKHISVRTKQSTGVYGNIDLQLEAVPNYEFYIELRNASLTYSRTFESTNSTILALKNIQVNFPVNFKVVAFPLYQKDNIFNYYWHNERIFIDNIKKDYSINYFLSTKFFDIIEKTIECNGQGFDLASQDHKKTAQYVLKTYIVKSLDKFCIDFLNNLNATIPNIYRSLIEDHFAITPILKLRLLELIQNEFIDINAKAREFYRIIFASINDVNVIRNDTFSKVQEDIHEIRQHINSGYLSNIELPDTHINIAFCLKQPGVTEMILKNSHIMEIALICYHYWNNTIKLVNPMFLFIMRRLFVKEPLEELRPKLIDPNNFVGESMMSLMAPSEQLIKQRKDVNKAIKTIGRVLEQLEKSQLGSS